MGEGRNAWDADAVRGLRERLGLTQRELADELGVRQQTVSEWETGIYRPRGASARMLRVVAERGAGYEASPRLAPEDPTSEPPSADLPPTPFREGKGRQDAGIEPHAEIPPPSQGGGRG